MVALATRLASGAIGRVGDDGEGLASLTAPLLWSAMGMYIAGTAPGALAGSPRGQSAAADAAGAGRGASARHRLPRQISGSAGGGADGSGARAANPAAARHVEEARGIPTAAEPAPSSERATGAGAAATAAVAEQHPLLARADATLLAPPAPDELERLTTELRALERDAANVRGVPLPHGNCRISAVLAGDAGRGAVAPRPRALRTRQRAGSGSAPCQGPAIARHAHRDAEPLLARRCVCPGRARPPHAPAHTTLAAQPWPSARRVCATHPRARRATSGWPSRWAARARTAPCESASHRPCAFGSTHSARLTFVPAARARGRRRNVEELVLLSSTPLVLRCAPPHQSQHRAVPVRAVTHRPLSPPLPPLVHS